MLLLHTAQPLDGEDVQRGLRIDLHMLLGTQQHQIVRLIPQRLLQQIPAARRARISALPNDVRDLPPKGSVRPDIAPPSSRYALHSMHLPPLRTHTARTALDERRLRFPPLPLISTASIPSRQTRR